MRDSTDWFMGLAAHAATRSKDPSLKVGAVVADSDRRIISTGYNGFPKGTSDACEIYDDRGEKLRRVLHAEANAVLFARRDLTGCTLYSTHHLCGQCAAIAIQAGIAKVVYPAGVNERWRADYDTSIALMREAGVEVVELRRNARSELREWRPSAAT